MSLQQLEGRGKLVYENGDKYYGAIACQAQNNSNTYPIDYTMFRSGEVCFFIQNQCIDLTLPRLKGEMHQADGSRYIGSFVKDQVNFISLF